MKRLFTLLVTVATSISFFAQSPQKMSYQAVIRNASGALVTNNVVGMKISILQGSETGTPVYVETQTPTTNDNGLATIEIGGGTVVTGTFEGIKWESGTYFLKTEVDPDGSTNYTIICVNQLLSVPYALVASKLSIIKNGQPWDLYISDDGTLIALPKITVEYPFGAVPTITDADGNTYNTVKIGTQVWMAENLKTTKYNDNTSIPPVTDNDAWGALSTPAYCWYNNDETNKNTYGALYNWYVVGTGKLCPGGWHVPTNDEWTILKDYLGSMAGGRMKETGMAHWITPNKDATNESKFTALPGGFRAASSLKGIFLNIGTSTFLWSATENDANAWDWDIFSGSSILVAHDSPKQYGDSVRCLRD